MQTQRNAVVKEVLKGSCSGLLFGWRGEFLGEPGSLAMLATLPSDFSQKQVALDWSLGPWPSLGKLSVVSTAIGGFLREPGPEALAGRTLLRFSSKIVVLLGFIAAPGLQHYARNYARIMRAQCAKPFAGVVQECVRQWMHSVRNRAIGPTLGPSLALCIMCGLCAPNARSSFHTCF